MSGTTDQLDTMTDHFGSGLRALQEGRYSTAAEEFRTALSTGGSGSAHFHLAVALLHGRAPGNANPERIRLVEEHLARALEYAGTTAALQAQILSAIVQDDYHHTAPSPDLSRVLSRLTADDLWPLLNHVGTPTGAAWQAVCQRVGRIDDQSARAEAVQRYFTPTPIPQGRNRYAVLFGFAGLLAILALVLFNAASFLIAVLALWITKQGAEDLRVHQRYRRHYAAAEPKPSDEEMDAWLDDDISTLVSRASTRVLLDTRLKSRGGDLIHPVQAIVGLPDVALRGPLRIRRGRDTLIRASSYEILLVFLTDSLLCTYHCQLDFGTGDITVDQTTEWHYTDIVSTKLAAYPVPDSLMSALRHQDREFARETPLEQILTIANTNGETLSVGTGFTGHADFRGEIAWPNPQAQTVIRRMIREHHGISEPKGE